MGIDANLAYHIARSTRVLGLSGSVCTLGVATEWASSDELDRAIHAAGLEPTNDRNPFLRIGFKSLESTDVSGYEGCTHILDLNTDEFPQALSERYDVIYNGGTLEHVFDIRSALRNIFKMLRPGGAIIHFLPMNGWVDHGFYQFSPTFFVDYYIENGFDVLDARLMCYEPSRHEVKVYPYVPGALDVIRDGAFAGSWLYYGVARKTPQSTWNRIPLQSRYTSIHNGKERVGAAALKYFLPYQTVGGEVKSQRVDRFALTNFHVGEGHELLAHLPRLSKLADDVPSQISPLMLMEDGQFSSQPHALHNQIREHGRGAYSHWGEWLHFSTSDNGSPEGRLFEVVVPENISA